MFRLCFYSIAIFSMATSGPLYAFKRASDRISDCDQQLLQIAQNLSDKNNFLVSIIIYQKLIKTNPNAPEYYYRLGRAYYKMQSFGKAAQAYKKALQLDPNNQDIMLGLAYSYLLQYTLEDDLHYARNLFISVLKHHPGYTDAREGLSQVNKLLGISDHLPEDPPPDLMPRPVPIAEPIKILPHEDPLNFNMDLVSLYGALTKSQKETPYFYYEFGRALIKMNAWNEAVTTLEEALVLQPDNADVSVVLGFALIQRHTNKILLYKSKHLFEHILAINSSYTEASTGLKRVDDLLQGLSPPPQKTINPPPDACRTTLLTIAEDLEAQNNPWATVMFYKELIATDPKNADYYYHLGRAYVKAKSWEKAIDAFNTSLSIRPDNPDAQVSVAYAYLFRYLSRCDLSESHVLFQEVLASFPNYVDAQEGLRRVHSLLLQLSETPETNPVPTADPEDSEEKKKLKKDEEWEELAVLIAKELAAHNDHLGAVEVYKKLIEVRPKNGDYYYLLGRQYVALDDTCSAIEAFKETLRLSPKYFDALLSLAGQYANQSLFSFALEFYWRALEVKPESVEALRGLAYVEWQLDQPKNAEDLYLRALEVEPNNIDVLKGYGGFLQSQRRYLESENTYRSIIAIANDFRSYRSTLLDLSSHTAPTYYSKIGKGVEREKNIFNNKWGASLTYTNIDTGIIYPLHDKLRYTLRGRWGDLKQKNLISNTTLFDCKFAGFGLGAEYFFNPYWSYLAGVNFLWVTNDNSKALLYTKKGSKVEPSLLFHYVKDNDNIVFGEITDTYVYKNFDKNHVTSFTRETATVIYQHDFQDNLKAGAVVAWMWFQDPIYNQEQDLSGWVEAGLPYFENTITCRYHSDYRQMKKETTAYYSFQYMWTHWLKFRWYNYWDFGGHCELLYWHGWRTIRGKNPQQQITTTALAALAPVVTIEDQINALYLTLGYSPDENCDLSATGSYWNDSYDYTVWGANVSFEWRF